MLLCLMQKMIAIAWQLCEPPFFPHGVLFCFLAYPFPKNYCFSVALEKVLRLLLLRLCSSFPSSDCFLLRKNVKTRHFFLSLAEKWSSKSAISREVRELTDFELPYNSTTGRRRSNLSVRLTCCIPHFVGYSFKRFGRLQVEG